MPHRPWRDFYPSLYCKNLSNRMVLEVRDLNLKQVNQPGTYWYHSHNRGQYPDGFRGPILIHDPASPYASQYDQELVLTLSDWYHKQMPELIPGFLSPTQNPDGAGKPASFTRDSKQY